MKYLLIFTIVLCQSLHGESFYVSNFTGETMRLDFVLAGDHVTTKAFLSDISKESKWYGSSVHLKEPCVNGNFYFQITDSENGNVLYEKSFSTLFGEWQTTKEAIKDEMAFQQTVFFPCPRKRFRFTLFKRKDRFNADTLLIIERDPGDFLIENDRSETQYESIVFSGPPQESLDIVFLSEGYTKEEEEKFNIDAKRFADYFLNFSPFLENKDKINIHSVFSASVGSGTDNPGDSVWIKTPVDTRFYTFGSERYLTTREYWKICDKLVNVPKDQICIIVNTDKYGGGGIYNFYNISSSDHPMSGIVLIHEFGHGFAGLGDEYYNSEVAYEDFFDLSKEPLPPNLTTLVDFDSKWKDMLDEDIPVPTPANKRYKNKVGVFEGGGYVAKGVFRPQQECRMKSNDAPGFCEVCKRALIDMIYYYSGD